MRIILSRKGFDSTSGCYPSPILDNKFITLPIPDPKDSIYYTDLILDDGRSYLELMKSLNMTDFNEATSCHLDPDLNKNVKSNREGTWLPTIGQMDKASIHLKNNNIKKGDVFLFFGRFRKVENNKFIGPEFHAIFGYLQIGTIIKPSVNDKFGLNYHPHYHEDRLKNPTNILYVASDKLSFNKSLPGAGMFTFNENLILTKRGYSASKWKLLDIFKSSKITYHENAIKDDYFQSAGRGQEFIFNENINTEEWAKDLINNYSSN